ILRGQHARPLGGLVPEERPNAQDAVALIEEVEFCDPIYVDEMSRAREAQLKQRNQALAAGQDLALIAYRAETVERLDHRVTRAIFTGRSHRAHPLRDS